MARKPPYPKHYIRWRNMLARCQQESCPNYPWYGGRGIRVCERWQDFDAFASDVEALPGTGSDLDRIDVNGDYEPSNCRWATRRQNQRNQRRSHLVTWQGATLHYIEWAERLGLKPETLRSRLYRRQWPINRAMTEGVTCPNP